MDYLRWLQLNIGEPHFWFQPLFYAVHGYVATEMALLMLFRPYEPVYIPGTSIQLPFTPGIFPRGRHKLSVAIADTITDMLITPQDIQRQTAKLVTEDNIYNALEAIFDSVGEELRDLTQVRSLYRFIDDLVPAFLNRFASDAIAALETGDDQGFNQTLERFLTFALPKIHVTYDQMRWAVDHVFQIILTPREIRLLMIDLLTDQNIESIDRTIRSQIHGFQGLLMTFFDMKKGLTDFRHFLMTDPAGAEQFIVELIDEGEIREKLAMQLLQFSPHNLAAESLEIIRQGLTQTVRNLLIENKAEIAQMVTALSEEVTHSMTHHLLSMDYKAWAEKSLPGVKRDIARFVHTYLHRQLENLLRQALPALSMNTVIVEKIDKFSARELEQLIQRICHRELRGLALLGAFLGLWLGLVSNLMAYWIHPITPP